MSDERRITEPAETSGVSASPPITRLQAQTAHLAGVPVIVFLQPETVSYVDAASGELRAADSVELSVTASGAQRLAPVEFPPGVQDEWRARLDTRTDELVIHFPGGRVFYDGTAPTSDQWRTDVAARGRKRGNPQKVTTSVVVVTGPMASVRDIEPVILAGRAHWLRVPLAMTR
ncbi:hypothetical protein [Streptomyces sp. Da 82-17]|uniref:hypothetical protein n=1 Tax=Streptomyces sp. Da 82-17 TaxID=3377116 RepID=UPI0038D47D7B